MLPLVGGSVEYSRWSESEGVCSREVAFTVLSSHPAAAAAGFMSNTVCLGKLPPLGKNSAACASLPPPPPPPREQHGRSDHDHEHEHAAGAVADHLLPLRGRARLALAFFALPAEALLLLPAMGHDGGG